MSQNQSAYEVLGVSRGASPQDIKRQYHQLALQHHPDKQGNSEAFARLQQAYDILRSDSARRAHDASLEQTDAQIRLYDTISLSKMEQLKQQYQFPCRCGSNYTLERHDFDVGDAEVLVGCDSCSFTLKVLLK